MLIYFYSEWRMVFVVILAGMHQLQSAERLRPRDSEADKFVHEPDATQRRAHLPRLPTSRKATALPSVQVEFGKRISCLLLSDRNNIIESPATHDGVIYGASLPRHHYHTAGFMYYARAFRRPALFFLSPMRDSISDSVICCCRYNL